jgi:hypothetical protein
MRLRPNSMRLAVLRLADLDTLYAKEPGSPVVMALRPETPLFDAQIKRLVVATPWNPVMIEANVGRWQESIKAFPAEIQTVESAPKPPTTGRHRRRVPPQSLLRQFRGFIAHD